MTVSELQKAFLPKLAPEDFFILLSKACGKEKAFLLAHPEFELDTDASNKAESFFLRRLRHEPVAYITGEKEFFGHSFAVNRSTLIPRPETEDLIEQVLFLFSSGKITGEADIVDLGTGSGAIIITVGRELKKRGFPFSPTLFAIDISEEALTTAKENAKQDAGGLPITFLQGNLLEPYEQSRSPHATAVILANLPYVSQELYEKTAPDIREYEPKSALLSGQAGLAHYIELLTQLSRLPEKNVFAFFEISPEQSAAITEEVRARLPRASCRILRDLSGKDRIVSLEIVVQ